MWDMGRIHWFISLASVKRYNIAIEDGPFIVDVPIKSGDGTHSCVSLLEGIPFFFDWIYPYNHIYSTLFLDNPIKLF
jgi:hypothetical protein